MDQAIIVNNTSLLFCSYISLPHCIHTFTFVHCHADASEQILFYVWRISCDALASLIFMQCTCQIGMSTATRCEWCHYPEPVKESDGNCDTAHFLCAVSSPICQLQHLQNWTTLMELNNTAPFRPHSPNPGYAPAGLWFCNLPTMQH